ncbi:MAG: GNAT family N-acetyltransferase [Actinomycetota bacterium]|nr:GNAT family N-acetyltransferase [Actinomycetota bacterium]
MLKNEANRNLEELEIGALNVSEVEETLGVVVRGMRDNPTHIAAFGENPEVRERRIRRLFSSAFVVLDLPRHMLAARSADGEIVGAMGIVPPGECRPSAAQQLRLLPLLLANGLRSAGRTAKWMGAWNKHDPTERHWHFGPLAVDAHLQGKGIGSKLMRVFCARMDAAGEDAYLETDKLINVRFYERFGFEVVGEEEVIGVTNWYMLRPAKRRY